MAQAFICDTCQKHEEPKDNLSLPPTGWYMVYQRTKATAHFCSPACLTTAARKDLETEQTLKVSA